jgi:hypothetical protein
VNIRAVLRECATDLLATEPTVTVDKVVTCAWQRHGDAFDDARDNMVMQAARDIVAKLMRDLSSDDEQQTLPGIAGLPSAICVPAESGTYYVRADKARWEELQLGRAVRVQNVDAAQRKLDLYDRAMKDLRPYMLGRPEVTVADALRLMAGQSAEVA